MLRWIGYGGEQTTGGFWYIHRSIPLLLLLLLLAACSTAKVVVVDDPLTPEEHINLGVVNEKRGNYMEALRQYRMASRELPIALFYMGNACFRMKDYGCAEDSYRKALEKMPDNADVMNNLAWLYYTMGKKLREARELVEQAIKTRPERQDIYMDTLVRINEALQRRKED